MRAVKLDRRTPRFGFDPHSFREIEKRYIYMENFIAVVLAAAVLGGILWLAKRFLKPVKGPLPDCCGGKGNRDVKV